jgi:hypothetical protein
LLGETFHGRYLDFGNSIGKNRRGCHVQSSEHARTARSRWLGPITRRLRAAKSRARFAHLVGVLLADNAHHCGGGDLLGLLVRLLYENFIFSAKPLIPVTRYGGYVINYATAFFVMHYILGKTFRHFRLALISSGSAFPTQILKPSFVRTLRVWWIFTWRTVLYTVISFALVIYPMGWFVGIFRPGALFASLFFLLLGFVVSGALSLFVIYSNILEEDIGDFRVALLPRQSVVLAQNPLAADPAPLG